MRRGQTTLEYVCLIGIAAAALITMLVYMGRGFQGNVRSLSDQIGAGQYDPQNTQIQNVEVKQQNSLITSLGTSKVTYGSEDGSSPGKTKSSSSNKDETTVVTTKQTSEKLGRFENDTWN